MATNKVVFGNNTLIDLTSDTVTAADLASGVTAHNASGVQITGTSVPVTVFDTQVTLAAASWETMRGADSETHESWFVYHRLTVNVANILSTDKPILDVVISSEEYGDTAQLKVDQWGYIGSAVTGSGTITFYCYTEGKKPTVDLTVNVKVVR